LEYFKEYYKEVKKLEKKPKNKEIKEVMRELDDKIENLSNENYCLDNFDEKYIRKILDKYKKK
jgi:arsenate reductase-like glutaredoxin family protein